jgi:hypothetical protein
MHYHQHTQYDQQTKIAPESRLPQDSGLIEILKRAHSVNRNLKQFCSDERKTLVDILKNLDMIRIQFLHLQLGYKTLFDYCRKELKYSAGATHRRLCSMKLLSEIPEIEPSIRNGELSLSVLTEAWRFFQYQLVNEVNYLPHEKLAIIQTLLSKSKVEAQKILINLIAPSKQVAFKTRLKERASPISSDVVELTIFPNQQTLLKFSRAKEMLAHKLTNHTFIELFEKMADFVISELDPADVLYMPLMQENQIPTDEDEFGLKSKTTPNTTTVSSHEDCKLQDEKNTFMSSGLDSNPLTNYNYSSSYCRQFVNSLSPQSKKKILRRSSYQCSYRSEDTTYKCSNFRHLGMQFKIHPNEGGPLAIHNITMRCQEHLSDTTLCDKIDLANYIYPKSYAQN